MILTKQAFTLISTMRGAIDPRSRVMILYRPFDTLPTEHPIIRFEGVTTDADKTKEAKDAGTKLFKEQLEQSLSKHNITISGIEEILENRGKTQIEFVDVHFAFTNHKPATIKPNIFPPTYNGPDGTRKIKASWTRPCRQCLSESHTKSNNGQCPWLTTNLPNNIQPSDSNYSSLRPGQTERRMKHKRDEDDKIIDLRPTDKKRKLSEEEKDEMITTKATAEG
jgi:hypothetical protein